MPRTTRVSRRAILKPESLKNFFRCTPFPILLRVYQIPPQKTTIAPPYLLPLTSYLFYRDTDEHGTYKLEYWNTGIMGKK
jgi:hypothetical protein